MIYHLVQPWGRDTYRQAGPISSHPTVEEAYAELDRIAAMLARDDLPETPWSSTSSTRTFAPAAAP